MSTTSTTTEPPPTPSNRLAPPFRLGLEIGRNADGNLVADGHFRVEPHDERRRRDRALYLVIGARCGRMAHVG